MFLKFRFSLIIVVSVFINLGFCLNENDACVNPRQQSGKCIPANNCQLIMDIIRSKPKPEEARFAMNSKCGSSNSGTLVCCPTGNVGGRIAKLPAPGDCGSAGTQDRIVGGEKTALDAYRWMARLGYDKGPKGIDYHCGGSIINEKHVLTAAHCINDVPASWRLKQVRLGEWNTATNPDCLDDACADKVVDIDIDRIIVHPSYNKTVRGKYHDIALLKLKRAIVFTDWIQPICLPVTQSLKSAPTDNVIHHVAGWGATETSIRSQYKLELKVPGVPLSQCNDAYRKLVKVDFINSQLCAGGERGRDSCKGDSGGPLMRQDNSDPDEPYWYLVGVVSFGSKYCGTENLPGVYTKVSEYMNWIESNLTE
uniref:CLIP domain-containing serine protease n=1 Tax=Corethrella appendiculata TaxID=1370023 RepID=U5ERA5_9DIPT